MRFLEHHAFDNSVITQDQSIPRTTAAGRGFDVVGNKMHTAVDEGHIHPSEMAAARPSLSVLPTVDPTCHLLVRQDRRAARAKIGDDTQAVAQIVRLWTRIIGSVGRPE